MGREKGEMGRGLGILVQHRGCSGVAGDWREKGELEAATR